MNHELNQPIATRLLVIGLVALLSSCGTLREAKLRAPTWFGLEEIAPRVYVSRKLADPQRVQLLESLQQACSQMLEVYGAVVSSPVVYACATRDCYESFNGYGDGRAVADGILLLPKSFIPEAISHEWSHVELRARVGRSGYRKIPMWFHEGLAVAVSKLPNHSDETLRKAKARGFAIPKDIKALGERKVWSNALNEYQNAEGLNIMYAAAGHEVRNWLTRVGPRGLLELIEAMNSSEEFIVAYDRIALAARTVGDNAPNSRFEADAQNLRAVQP